MLKTRLGMKISPEVRKPKQSSMNKEQPVVATPANPDRRSLREHIAEVKRQWKATTQMNLPVLRAVKDSREQQHQ